FAYVYPNDDDYYRLYDDNGITFYDVKAHSIYFQQLIENGGIALFCFVCFYLVLVRRVLSAKGSADDAGALSRTLAIGILFGTVFYMLCCLTVDSNVTSAPVFWALMGILAGTADIHT
ncbi:MAG: hypothetical protein IK139_01075, partial [Lachnospiraceae bacterium]|nr:hypothetical protein [Lachnospiraceae bacterium]